MTQSPLPTQKTRNFAHKALKALGFVNINRLFESSPPAMAAPTTTASLANGALDGVQAPPSVFEIAREDWDALFRAIRVRLAHAVDEQRGLVRAPQAGDVADHLQTVVLGCVTDLAKLQAALTQERACTDASSGPVGQV